MAQQGKGSGAGASSAGALFPHRGSGSMPPPRREPDEEEALDRLTRLQQSRLKRESSTLLEADVELSGFLSPVSPGAASHGLEPSRGRDAAIFEKGRGPGGSKFFAAGVTGRQALCDIG